MRYCQDRRKLEKTQERLITDFHSNQEGFIGNKGRINIR